MRETIDKVFKLGLGVVIAGKEQIEKTVNELVEKGEVSRTESKALVDEWLQKGEATKEQIERYIREKVETTIQESHIATKADIARLEQRLEALETHDERPVEQ